MTENQGEPANFARIASEMMGEVRSTLPAFRETRMHEAREISEKEHGYAQTLRRSFLA